MLFEDHVMFGILARTFNTMLRREEWDVPDYWKQRCMLSDREAQENEIQRRRGQFVGVGQW